MLTIEVSKTKKENGSVTFTLTQQEHSSTSIYSRKILSFIVDGYLNYQLHELNGQKDNIFILDEEGKEAQLKTEVPAEQEKAVLNCIESSISKANPALFYECQVVLSIQIKHKHERELLFERRIIPPSTDTTPTIKFAERNTRDGFYMFHLQAKNLTRDQFRAICTRINNSLAKTNTIEFSWRYGVYSEFALLSLHINETSSEQLKNIKKVTQRILLHEQREFSVSEKPLRIIGCELQTDEDKKEEKQPPLPMERMGFFARLKSSISFDSHLERTGNKGITKSYADESL